MTLEQRVQIDRLFYKNIEEVDQLKIKEQKITALMVVIGELLYMFVQVFVKEPKMSMSPRLHYFL